VSIKILAVSGSSRRGSLNQKLLDIAANGARDAGATVTSIRLTDFALPLYDGDLEVDQGVPREVRRLQAEFAKHDALLIATPEFNGGYTAALKNALDWVSRPQEDGTSGVTLLAGKVAALVSASPGQLGGLRSQLALRTVLDKLGVVVIPDAFALGLAHKAFEGEIGLKDKAAEKAVIGVGVALSRTAERLAVK
jgi:NAD(P)H-dependent FMN reductase